MTWPHAIGLLIIALGLFLGDRALAARTRRVALLRNFVRVRGRVVRVLDVSSEGDASTYWQPIAVYPGQEGATHEFKLDVQTDRGKFPVGKTVPIFHERGVPENATAERRLWEVNLACAGCLFVILLGVLFFFAEFRSTTPRPHRPPAAVFLSPLLPTF